MLQEYWGGGRGGVKLEKITELPALVERPQPGQMGGSSRQSGFRDRYEQERGMYQRSGQRDLSRSSYGGKESFKRGFIPDRYGERESFSKGFNSDRYAAKRKSDFSFRDNKNDLSDDFDNWLDNSGKHSDSFRKL